MHIIDKIFGLRTYWWLEIFEENPNLDEIRAIMENTIVKLEKDLSQFHSESLTSRLNSTKSVEEPTPEFLGLLSIGTDLYDRTNGIFHFGLGEILEKMAAKPYSPEFQNNPESFVPDVKSMLTISENRITLSENTKLDFGGYGRGHVLDTLAAQLKNYGLKYFALHGNGSVYVTSKQDEPYVIELMDPFNPRYELCKVALKNVSLSSSSPLSQRWQKKKSHTRYTNIVNPKTLKRVTNTGAFVIHDSAVYSEGFATALSIIGGEVEEAETIIEKNNLRCLSVVFGERLATSDAFSEYVI